MSLPPSMIDANPSVCMLVLHTQLGTAHNLTSKVALVHMSVQLLSIVPDRKTAGRP